MSSVTSRPPRGGSPVARSVRRAIADRVRPLPAPARRALANPVLEALTTPHGVSRFLETVHPLWTLDGGRAKVTDVRRETADVSTLTLEPDHVWQGFQAGQHVRVGVVIDGAVRTRTYSVSSSAHRADGAFTITVKRKDDGLVSGHLTTRVAPGDVLHCSAATGEVVLPDPRPDRLLLVSAGSGITPVASMLRTLADEAHPGRVTFLHYARTADDVPLAAELRDAAARLPDAEVVVVHTADGSCTAGFDLRGHCDADHLAAVAPDHLEIPTIACGPTELIDTLEDLYEDGGSDQLQVERFTPRALVAAGAAVGGTVRFATSDVDVVDDGRTLLEQAEAAGLEPANGCRMGICHTCTRVKPSGAVTDLRTGRVSDGPDQPVQICVSVPAGDVVLDL